MLSAMSFLLLLLLPLCSTALKFDTRYLNYNLNQNQTASAVADYSGLWENHTFHPSPSNWRMPFYTLFLDKFVNGDPTNDDINGTQFEYDSMQTQLRHGGDLQGLVDSLDYIQGMGIEAIYIAGTPFFNQPWGADGYSPLDLSLLDQHFGDISAWRNTVTEIHNRGMYIMLDNTVSTMGDLLGFEGHLNSSTPFSTQEYKATYKDPSTTYTDWFVGDEYNQTCAYPKFWLETGFPVGSDVTDQLVGCYNSEFDQYGDFNGLGDFDGWKRSLSKAASVQDRLRDWVPSVREKIEHFSCLAITMLDIDGYRIDKATQVTIDALGDFSQAMRKCARTVGKDNFFISGEISGGNTFGSLFIGRGRQPDMQPQTALEAVTMTNTSNSSLFLREDGKGGLDSAAFQYSIYRSLTKLLGMDGVIGGPNDAPINLVQAWDEFLLSNDMVNANTGFFDPRAMYGTTNQDNFRWSAIKNGTEKLLLGQFITTLQMPGIPLLLWGEEQAFYVLDSTSDNYIFGRQAMSSSQAWKIHGCYNVGSSQYNNFLEDGAPALTGCYDDWNTLDHRDPTHPVRNIIKSMYQMRKNYPALNDGWTLQELSSQTHDIFLPGSEGASTEIGMWSTMRSNFNGVQDLSATGQGNQTVWLVYQNDNHTVEYDFNCAVPDRALITPFAAGTIVKNLFFPFDELTLETGLGDGVTSNSSGCLNNLTLSAWEYRAYVPRSKFVEPTPMITEFLPGHDARLEPSEINGILPIELHFSAPMNCSSVSASILLQSSTETGTQASLDSDSVECSIVPAEAVSSLFGSLPTTWKLQARLLNVTDGVHVLAVQNPASINSTTTTGSIDRFFIRVGQNDNPIVSPQNANYSRTLLHRGEDGQLFISHKASGADIFRYSLNWGSSFSAWQTYAGGNTTIAPQPWSGTSAQKWNGEHVIVQYHSDILGSSNHIQHGDLNDNLPARRFPHLFLEGEFNQFGSDAGIQNKMELENDSIWAYDFLAEWPSNLQVNQWGVDPSGKLDVTSIFGDVDGDGILDRLPPSSLIQAMIAFNHTPQSPFLSWKFSVNDGDYSFKLTPTGNRWHQLLTYILLWTVPLLTGCLGVWLYLQSFYQVKFNKIGIPGKSNLRAFPSFPAAFRYKQANGSDAGSSLSLLKRRSRSRNVSEVTLAQTPSFGIQNRRKVLIATMEYDIEDWAIKVKIGGLGVMAQLMGKNLGHQDLIWVVPCVGGIDYPQDTPAESMDITILGNAYKIDVQYHILNNITYVILDAPVFRAQSKAEPYPARMDDIDSAIFYSAWNQCIALAIKRFSPDLYHINDYHGALAPIHLLPETIPCCLSLHNAEFQGLWGMRSEQEQKEVCEVYNIPKETAQKYVQFGDVFNLLHAGASYLRVHQKGFGAVGVSKKYGKRSWGRYPIFWGLSSIGQLPNPDPSDLAEWTGEQDGEEVVVDQAFEESRGDLRKQAQEWAGLNVDPDAELLVFVGRWSMQKGIDLIADVMPALLEENPKVQLICVGPVIDLYGKFAALKLDFLMKEYPGRVFSKPEFTALPPFIFSGAEFALIPSRDEPFGLVAVEFGRKGALGIGARVGGLGQMPGWWFTVETTTTTHLLRQFKKAIKDALSSKKEMRVEMRARSAKQRFPVAQWVHDLEELQSTAIKIHQKEATCTKCEKPSAIRNSRSHSPSISNSRQRSSSHSLFAPGAKTRKSKLVDQSSRNRSSSHSIPRSNIELLPNGAPERPTRVLSRRDRSLSQSGRLSRTASPQITPLSRARSPLGNVTFSAGSIDVSAESSVNSSPNIMPMGLNENWTPSHRRQASSRMSLAPTSSMTSPFSSPPGTPPYLDDDLLLPPSNFYELQNVSTLSLEEVVGDKKDFSLQMVDPSFTDSTGEYFKLFRKKLNKLDASNSESDLCIEYFLVQSEKAWFTRFRAAKLDKLRPSSPSVFNLRPSTPMKRPESHDEFEISESYERPRGVRRYLQFRIGDWPLYTILLALGQIMGANSYQITLLSGPRGQSEEKFYIISGIYLVASIGWWLCFRLLKSVHLLSIPFTLYALSLLLLGLSVVLPTTSAISGIQNTATGLYTIASASGSLYFALNFGDEGGSPVKSWVFRACVIQGTQQVYMCALWFWGSRLSESNVNPISNTSAPILFVVAAVLFGIGVALYMGLPSYYRQSPGKLPSFYAALCRRKIVIWFFITVIIQSFFLSTLTGRNWSYLWSSKHTQVYQIVLLAIFFFIILWAAFLWAFGILSRTHTWILPLFAIGLGAPRWCQILWSCTPIGAYMPWAGGPVASAMFGRGLWLWLGLLDALQGVGFGMILLQTLTRAHIAATLVGAQAIGAAVTMLARAVGPTKLGPGTVFPDFSMGSEGLRFPWFWIGLLAQISICVGFAKFFRKEQLSKP